MIRLLIRIAISLASAAVGLLLCALLLPEFHLQPAGFVMAVVVLAGVEAILSPLIIGLTRAHAAAMIGGVGILTTLIALLLANLVPGGITVTSVTAWLLAALIVWVCMALGAWILVAAILKRRDRRRT